MASGTKRTMICCICHQRIDATIVQAKAHGWTVWVGGAFCKRHTESDDEPMRAEIDRLKADHAAHLDRLEIEQADTLVLANAQREQVERLLEAERSTVSALKTILRDIGDTAHVHGCAPSEVFRLMLRSIREKVDVALGESLRV